jgi:hypothetical protein
MNYSRPIPPTDERGVEQPPQSAPQFRFINCDDQGFGILVEQIDGVRHARAARFFVRGRR